MREMATDAQKVENMLRNAFANAKKNAEINSAGAVQPQHWSLVHQEMTLRRVRAMSEERKAEVLHRGENTQEFRDLKDAEVILGYRGNKDWKGKDEMRDKTSRFSLENAHKHFANEPVEVLHTWDEHGRYLGWTRGSENSVQAEASAGALIKGYTYHNHPSDGVRPLGQPPSVADFRTDLDQRTNGAYIGAREGIYKYTSVPTSVKEKQLDNLEKKLSKGREEAKLAAGKMFPNDLIKQRDAYMRGWHLNSMKTISTFCEKHGIGFAFRPNRGYENLLDPKHLLSPLPKT